MIAKMFIYVCLCLFVLYLVDLAEAALAQQHEQQVPVVEDWVVVEPWLVLVVDPLQLSDVEISFPLKLFHLQL